MEGIKGSSLCRIISQGQWLTGGMFSIHLVANGVAWLKRESALVRGSFERVPDLNGTGPMSPLYP